MRPKTRCGQLLLGRGMFSLLLTLALGTWPAAAQPITEYEVKAAMIFNLIRFTTFPDFGAEQRIRICSLPDYGGLAEVSRLKDRLVGENKIEVMEIQQASNAKSSGCRVLLFPSKYSDTEPVRLQANYGILTVGESEGFLERGGMIQFSLENQKIRFSVSRDATGESGLSISSKVLALANQEDGRR